MLMLRCHQIKIYMYIWSHNWRVVKQLKRRRLRISNLLMFNCLIVLDSASNSVSFSLSLYGIYVLKYTKSLIIQFN